MPGVTLDVTLCECFARDGLQHEPQFVPTAAKRALVERFAALGFPRVEATSYSNPKVVPQFADASDLLKSIQRKPGVFYKATCANVKAVERAVADLDAGYGANELSLLVSATESHTQRNLNRTRERFHVRKNDARIDLALERTAESDRDGADQPETSVSGRDHFGNVLPLPGARAVEVPLRVRLGRRDEQAQLVRSVASVEIGDGTLDRLHVGAGGLVENPRFSLNRLQ